MEGFIYIILNKINSKFYLGSTKNYHKRKLRHFNELSKNKHHSILLQRAVNKYGIDNFEFILIETCHDYINREQFLLNSIDFKDSYNVSTTATGGDLISNHPNRNLIIENATRILKSVRKPEPKFGEDNPNWRGGPKLCKCGKAIANTSTTCFECKPKTGCDNPFYGKKHTKETKSKLRELRKGKYSGNQEKQVVIENIIFRSVSEAARQLNVTPSTIINRIKNEKFENYSYV